MNIATLIRVNPNMEEEFLPVIVKHFKQFGEVVQVKKDFAKAPEHQVLNDALENIKADLVFIIDADEFLTYDDVMFIADNMQKNQKKIAMVQIAQYKTSDSIVPLTHTPIVCVHPSVRFIDQRCANLVGVETYKNIYLHHFSLLCKKTQEKLKKHWNKLEQEKLKAQLNAKTIPFAPPSEVLGVMAAVGNILGKRQPKAEPVPEEPKEPATPKVKKTRSKKI